MKHKRKIFDVVGSFLLCVSIVFSVYLISLTISFLSLSDVSDIFHTYFPFLLEAIILYIIILWLFLYVIKRVE